MDIEIPKPQARTPLANANFATEVALRALLKQAGQLGVTLNPAMGLMYLPDEAITRQFQEACRAVLASLGMTGLQD